MLISFAEGPPSTSNLLHLSYFVDLLQDVSRQNVFCVCSLFTEFLSMGTFARQHLMPKNLHLLLAIAS